jgi:hypothetical protein
MDAPTNRFVWTDIAALHPLRPVQSTARQKRDVSGEPRDEKGRWTEGAFAITDTEGQSRTYPWLRTGTGWHRSPEGEQPYGWAPGSEDYVPPKVLHKVVRGKNTAEWGYSHSGSQAITGAASLEMGIPGYHTQHLGEVHHTLAHRFLTAIAEDSVGSEEVLYHVFENVRGTVFKPGDTLKLPLTATSGDVGLSYGVRLDAEDQQGQPVVFEFEQGTQMAGYSTVTLRGAKDLGFDSIQEAHKEAGRVWDEAIVAGAYEVVGVKEVYMGSMHHRQKGSGKEIPQIYGLVVRLRQTQTFDPATKTWVPRG